MGGGFKLRLSRMFRASFGSCRSQSVAIFISQIRHGSSPEDGFARMDMLQSSEFTEQSPCFSFEDAKGRTCPPATPISPLNSYYKLEELEPRKGKIKSKERKHRKNQRSINRKARFHFDSSSGDTDSGWFSTEESEDEGQETDTFFSSKGLSSDSSENYLQRESFRRKAAEIRRRRASRGDYQMGYDPFDSGGKLQESIAVVKKSIDPYSDFRTSMVEMIVDKELFGAEDLEKLLQCFLNLNSSYYHRVIIEVFKEIWNTLFSNDLDKSNTVDLLDL